MQTLTWSGTLTALSSIAHGGDNRGTITLLRRELVNTPDGLIHVPVISGNSLRGRLRRVGEELLRDVVGYEGLLHPAAAHALRGGGALAKTGGEPLSGSRLHQLRTLVPQIGVFGAAGGGTIINGCLDVGKVVPHLSETAHITGVATDRSAFTATQLEPYTRQDDSSSHDFDGVIAPTADPTELTFDSSGRPDVVAPPSGNQMRYHLETFPAGTVFSTWLRLRRPTPLEASFFCDVLDTFITDGRLGGRVGIGHGQIRSDLHVTPSCCDLPDWREAVTKTKAEILLTLGSLA